MQILALTLITALIFLICDAVMISRVIQPYFKARLGAELIDGLRIGPAALFYLIYIGGLVYLVSLPALRAAAPHLAAINGTILGLVAYATYELTNHATLAKWTPGMVALDLAWGTVLTGFAAWAGVVATRAIFG